MSGESDRAPVHLEVASWTGGTPAFAVRPPVRALTIALYEETSGEPIWIVVSNSFSPMGGEVVGGVTVEASPSEALGVDNFVDLTGRAGAVASSFTYGAVPKGFQQMMPTAGGPRPLQKGARYVLVITGEEEARLTFEGRT